MDCLLPLSDRCSLQTGRALDRQEQADILQVAFFYSLHIFFNLIFLTPHWECSIIRYIHWGPIRSSPVIFIDVAERKLPMHGEPRFEPRTFLSHDLNWCIIFELTTEKTWKYRKYLLKKLTNVKSTKHRNRTFFSIYIFHFRIGVYEILDYIHIKNEHKSTFHISTI